MDLATLINVVLSPIICGILLWIWKLDARIYDQQGKMLTRDDFHRSIAELKQELKR